MRLDSSPIAAGGHSPPYTTGFPVNGLGCAARIGIRGTVVVKNNTTTQLPVYRRVGCGVIGGYALIIHGVRRFTEDIDVLVSSEDLDRLHNWYGTFAKPTTKEGKDETLHDSQRLNLWDYRFEF